MYVELPDNFPEVTNSLSTFFELGKTPMFYLEEFIVL